MSEKFWTLKINAARSDIVAKPEKTFKYELDMSRILVRAISKGNDNAKMITAIS